MSKGQDGKFHFSPLAAVPLNKEVAVQGWMNDQPGENRP